MSARASTARPSQLLGRHVVDGAHQHADPCERRVGRDARRAVASLTHICGCAAPGAACAPRDAEVEQLGAALGEHHVGGLEVAVHDPLLGAHARAPPPPRRRRAGAATASGLSAGALAAPASRPRGAPSPGTATPSLVADVVEGADVGAWLSEEIARASRSRRARRSGSAAKARRAAP